MPIRLEYGADDRIIAMLWVMALSPVWMMFVFYADVTSAEPRGIRQIGVYRNC